MVLGISNYYGNNLDLLAVTSHDFSVINYYVPFPGRVEAVPEQ